MYLCVLGFSAAAVFRLQPPLSYDEHIFPWHLIELNWHTYTHGNYTVTEEKRTKHLNEILSENIIAAFASNERIKIKYEGNWVFGLQHATSAQYIQLG